MATSFTLTPEQRTRISPLRLTMLDRRWRSRPPGFHPGSQSHGGLSCHSLHSFRRDDLLDRLASRAPVTTTPAVFFETRAA